jgi:MtN3 and saliva related transmembrane protein
MGSGVMSIEEMFGYAAAFLTTLSFLPQAIKVVRTRETGAISLSMYALFTAGVMLWGIYGLMTGQWSIIIANGITVVLAAIILVMKISAVMAEGRKARSPSAN